MRNIEVCFSPALFSLFDPKGKVVIVNDILRATTVIGTMFENGVEKVIPVKDIEEAKAYKEKGSLVVAERNGAKLDFADFGNSPAYFTKEVVSGQTLVYSTTNGTHAISIGAEADKVIIGSFLNFSETLKYVESLNKDVIILCAGWKGKFNLEDSIYAGAVAQELLKTGKYNTICDSTLGAIDLWEEAEKDVLAYIDKAAQRSRLRNMGLDEVIPYCFQKNVTDKVPVFENGYLKDYRDL